jgi:hypothetical protein
LTIRSRAALSWHQLELIPEVKMLNLRVVQC